MRYIIAPGLFVVAALLASCKGTQSQTPENALLEATETPSSAPSLSTEMVGPATTSTRQVTLTPLPPLPTPTVMSAPTIPPEVHLTIRCLDVAPQLPPGATSEGIVVLDSRVDFDTFLMNMTTGDSILMNKQAESTNENLVFFSVSPNRKWLAFNRVLFEKPVGKTIEDQLVIATADGQPQKAISWEKGWVHGPGWLDNQNLVINIAGKDPDENSASKAATLMVLNPFTGQRQTLRPEFPEIYDLHPVPDWEGWGETAYDPMLIRVVYLRWLEDGSYAYALWDLQNRQILAVLGIFDYSRTPRWSSDGTQFVIAANIISRKNWLSYELYGVSRDGQITQLTNLTAYYPSVYIESYNWSPDGRYIAFWLNEEAKSDQAYGEGHLAILDTVTSEVTDYCVPGDYAASPAPGGLVPPPLWSPDGQQLIVENRYADKSSRVILVDIVQGFAAQIAENMMPVGWMISSP